MVIVNPYFHNQTNKTLNHHKALILQLIYVTGKAVRLRILDDLFYEGYCKEERQSHLLTLPFNI